MYPFPDVDSTLIKQASVDIINASMEEYLSVSALTAGVMLSRVSNSSIVLEAANGLVPDAFENLLGSIQYTIGQQRYSMYASSGFWL